MAYIKRNILSLATLTMLAASVVYGSATAAPAVGKNEEKTIQKSAEEPRKVSAEELYKISPDDMVIGDKNAKVTVIEYASMTCSHCADFHKNTYPEIKTKYIDTGKIKFVFRSFPLDGAALRAAMLANCSGKERFHKFTDVLFSTQSNWVMSKNYLEVLSNIGKLGGMSGEEVEKCLTNEALEKKLIEVKFNAATVLEVRSTPSFFINGHLYKGAHGFEFFSKVLDDELSGSPKETAKPHDAEVGIAK